MSANAPDGRPEPELRVAARSGDHEAAVAYSKLLSGRGDIDAALPWLEGPALAGNAYAARTLAIALRDRGEYEAAERWYRGAAGHDGGCAFGLADLLEKAGDEARAAEWYAKGTALGDLKCKTNGAYLLAAQGRQEEAEDRLREAMAEGDHVAGQALDAIEGFVSGIRRRSELIREAAEMDDPEDATAEALDAIADLDENVAGFRAYPYHLDEALSLYDEAGKVTGDDRPAVWKALFLDRLDRWDDARRILEEAAECFPEESYAPYVLGLIHRERGDLTQSERWLRKGAELHHPGSLWNLAVHCLIERRLDEAQRLYTAYGEHAAGLENPKDHRTALERVAEYRRQPSALSNAEKARLPGLRAAAEAGDPPAAFELARLLERRHSYAEAVTWYRTAAEAGHLRAERALGDLLYEEIDAPARHVHRYFQKSAEAAYRRGYAAPVAAPDDVFLIERVGHFHLAMDDKFNAEKWLRRAARLGHGNAAWWCGNRSKDHGDMQEAERMWSLATRRGVPWCGWLAGRSMVAREAYAEAEPLLRIAYDAREEDEPLHEAAYWLGRALRGQGRLDEAVQWLRTAVDVHGHVKRGYSGFMLTSLFDPRLELAEVLCELERDQECEAVLARILDAQPRHRTAHRIGARVAERRGDLEAVRAHLEHVVDDEDLSAGVSTEDIRRIFAAVHPH